MLTPPQIPGLRGVQPSPRPFLCLRVYTTIIYVFRIYYFALVYIISAYNYTYSERILAMPRTVYIGENLERLRLRVALSQIELAKKAGVTPAAVNRIERNRVEPQMRTVRKLAEALDVEPHVLIEGGP